MATLKLLIIILAFLPGIRNAYCQTCTLDSPDGQIFLEVKVTDKVEYSVLHKGHIILEDSPVSLTLSDGTLLGCAPRLKKRDIRRIRSSFPAFAYKKAVVPDEYNALELLFKGDYALEFRIYNDGIAYRFKTTRKDPFTVKSEEATFHFPEKTQAYVAYVRENGYHKDNSTNNGTFEEQFFKSFVNTYTHIALGDWNPKRLAFMPLLAEVPSGELVCLTESDLLDYPGMYLNGDGKCATLQGVFAPYPKSVRRGGSNDHQEVVTQREDFLARCSGKTDFPWRVLVITEDERQLIETDMVYRLASPSKIDDLSWIRPGKAAWEWWSDNSLSGVDFQAGINTQTYLYFIDFAAKEHLEYILIDAGWYGEGGIFDIIPGLNLEEVVRYGQERGIGVILWTAFYPFMVQMEEACRKYSEMGIKGFKIDFMDRDDQAMVAFHRRAAETAARYHLVIDFHGTYKPTGLNRTYPNVLNFEAVQGLEHMKWAAPSVNQVGYDVTMPFIRMLAGPIDYTQGAMRNASKKNYRLIYSQPMSQGTRCRQMAEYVIFDSPLSMLCDSPSMYLKEQECTAFIADIPKYWDQTIALPCKIGSYVTIARKEGDAWYVASLNDWTPRTLEIDLSFLKGEALQVDIFRDGMNASLVAEDYIHDVVDLSNDRKINIPMASGGGFIMKITKKL